MCVRVLLVEADDATRHIIAALLRKCSYRGRFFFFSLLNDALLMLIVCCVGGKWVFRVVFPFEINCAVRINQLHCRQLILLFVIPYASFAAAADGLKAWDTLKAKSQNIDIVLTEVELPTISGYGLLTMIVEHEKCKNIPVISMPSAEYMPFDLDSVATCTDSTIFMSHAVMSSHDSVNTVFKCMLKGAVDFLIKPIRKNELENLWQHVWRRHSSYDLSRVRYKQQEENCPQQKCGANSKNNAGNNLCRDGIESLHTEKVCDIQISCARPDIDAERACTQNMQDNILPDCISSSLVNAIKNREEDVCDRLADKLAPQESENEGCLEDANSQQEEKSKKDCQSKFSREVDLIGTMDKCSCRNHEIENYNELQADILDDARDQRYEPLLELPLGRHRSISTKNNGKGEFNMLNHSNSSAFSSAFATKEKLDWLGITLHSELILGYKRTVSFPPLTSNGCRRSELESSKDQVLFHGTASKYGSESLDTFLQDVNAPIGIPPNQYGRVSCSHLWHLSIPESVSRAPYGLSSIYGTVIQPLLYESGTPFWSSKSDDNEGNHSGLSHQSERETFSSGPHGDPHGQNFQKHFYEMQKESTHNSESLNGSSHIASVTGQNSTWISSVSHDNSTGRGSVCNGGSLDLSASIVSTKEAGSHSSAVRRAALMKFRLKRKERCHEKVHCQTRKRLAKERPRLAGKFVH
ncbi:hypothetical protein Taro_017633 [Colocasia esculenta]|uniref:Uncharacterized protein n=1 Tax=Colocasia esculenta TaxID=4460 RepID=A0A843UTT7_COLES|nr:hypothetical protein [Colocasia esculenta]